MKSLSAALASLFTGGPEPRQPGEDDMRVAAAALLVHAAGIDGATSEDEAGRLKALVQRKFSLSPAAANELLIAAERKERSSVDLYGFTARLKQTMTEDERRELIAMMWEIAYSDGKLDALEDNLIWRASELLNVSARDRMMLKKRFSDGV